MQLGAHSGDHAGDEGSRVHATGFMQQVQTTTLLLLFVFTQAFDAAVLMQACDARDLKMQVLDAAGLTHVLGATGSCNIRHPQVANGQQQDNPYTMFDC